MKVKRKLAFAAVGILGLTGVGVGTALAQSGGSNPPSPSATVSGAGSSTAPSEAAEPAGPDTDTLEEGDQTTPDAPGTEAEAEASEGSEKAGVEEPGDANLPGGGHADAPGEVDHQFEGAE